MADDATNPNSSDCVRVAVRVRPLNDREKAMGYGSTGVSWALSPTSMTQMVQKKPISANSFAFDHVFLEGIDNQAVYGAIAAPLVSSTVEGVNGVIFAYGQTAAGKTHTMLGNDRDPGITPRAIMDLFATISNTRGRAFLLRASYIEIYNEEIKDLLGNGTENLKIHEDVVNKRVYVNAKEEVVTSVDDVMKILMEGEQTRAVGVTNMNERSSRSHTIFTLRVESRENITDSMQEDDDDSDGVAVRASTLTLVDLAGSERAAHTKAEGQRLKEGGHINKSLLTLGTVIGKLSSGETVAHIPYRDSKLTRILQPALGGNARTAILCAVTPSLVHMDETLSTLRFASRAKKVTNNAHRNEFLDDRAKLKRALKELLLLKTKLAALTHAGVSPTSGAISASTADAFAQSELQNQKRIKMFTPMFEKLVAIASSEQRTRGTKRPSATSLERPGKIQKVSHPTSDEPQKQHAVVSDTWDTKSRLREALDLCGGPQFDSCESSAAASSQTSANSDKSDADLRFRALQAERELRQARSEIECERSAMEAEVEQLVSVADNAERSRETAQTEWAQAMSLLKKAQAKSIVDEIVEGAMMISERDRTIITHENEIRRIRGVEQKYEETTSKLSVTEKTLSDALKREKRGIGPLLKEKSAMEKKMGDIEGKLKGAKENGQRLQSEKATLEREGKMKNAQIRKLQAEVDRHRNKQKMVDERVTKKHEEEKKKLEDQISSLKQQKDKEEATVAEQKMQIENLESNLSATSDELKKTEEVVAAKTDELNSSNMKIEALNTQLRVTLDNFEQERIAAQEKLEAEQSRVEEGQVANENLKNELASALEEINKKEEIIVNKNEELAATNNKIELLNTELTEVRADFEQAMKVAEEKQQSVQQLVEEGQNALRSANVEHQNLMNASNAVNEKLSAEIRLVKDNLIACTLRADAAEKEGAVLQLRISEVLADFEHEKNLAHERLMIERNRVEEGHSALQNLRKDLEHVSAELKESQETAAHKTEELTVSSNKIDLLTTQLDEARTELEQEKKEAQENLDNMRARAEAARVAIARLNKDCVTVSGELTRSKQLFADKTEECRKLSAEARLARDNLIASTLRADAAEKEGAVLQLKLSEVLAEYEEEKRSANESLQMERGHLEATQFTLANHRIQLADITNELEKKQEALFDTTAELKDSNEKVERLTHELDAMRTSVDKNSLELQRSQEIVTRTSNELDASNEKIRMLASELDGVRAELEQEKASTQEKLESARCDVEEGRTTIENLRKDLATASDELEQSKLLVANKNEEVDEISKNVEALTKQLEDMQSEFDQEKKSALEKLEKMQIRVDGDQSALSDLENNLAATTEELKKSHEIASSRAVELAASKSEIEQLVSRLNEAETKFEQVKKALREKYERPALRELNGNKAATDKSLRTLKDKNMKLLVRCKSLLEENKLAALEKVKFMENKKGLLQRVEHLEGQLTQYGRGEGAIAKLKKQVRRADRTVQKLKGELASVEKLISEKGLKEERELLKRIADAEGNYTEVRQELDRLQKAYEEQQKINDAITKDAHRYHQKLIEREALWTKSVADRREKERLNAEALIKERRTTKEQV